MQTQQRPRVFVVDDDHAVLSLVGTSVTCLDVLRALRNVSPQCEAVLLTGYKNTAAAVDALKETLHDSDSPNGSSPAETRPVALVEVEREHIIRTLAMVRGNKAVAARLLGVSRRALYRQLERHGLHHRATDGHRTNGTETEQTA